MNRKRVQRLWREEGLRVPPRRKRDNGPELTAHALRDWCRFTAAETAFIEPGAPWQNPLVESFTAASATSCSTSSSSPAWPKPE